MKSVTFNLNLRHETLFEYTPVYDFFPIAQLQTTVRNKVNAREIKQLFEDILNEQR